MLRGKKKKKMYAVISRFFINLNIYTRLHLYGNNLINNFTFFVICYFPVSQPPIETHPHFTFDEFFS